MAITKLHGADQVKDYFRRHYTMGDYYAQELSDGEMVPEVLEGIWHGMVADAFDLSGPVKKRDFYSVIEKKHPTTGEYLGLRRDGARVDKNKEVVGYDVTFGVPKSLSNQLMMTGDQRIMDVFHRVVRSRVQEMQGDIAVRVRGKRNFDHAKAIGAELVKTSQGTWSKRVGNGVFAEFTHTTNRPEPDPETGIVFPDPHLHAHFVLGNFAYDADHLNMDGTTGGWLAIDIEMMKRRGQYHQARFHADLARGVADLGYEVVRRGDGFWDLKGHTQDMIDKTSRRKAAVLALAEKLGIAGDTKKVGKLAATMRRHKDETALSWAQVKTMWRGVFDDEEWRALLELKNQAQGNPVAATLDVGSAVDWASLHAFERDSTARMDSFKEAAYTYSLGQLGVQELDAEIDRRLQAGELFAGEDGGELKVSTTAIYLEEQYIRRFVEDGRGRFSRMGPRSIEWKTDLFASQKHNTAEQEGAAMRILRSHDRAIALRGPAGAGKTTLTQEVIGQLEDAGRKVLTMAPQGRGRQALAAKGFDAQTVARFLADTKAQASIDRGDVLWIDEAGLVGTVDTARIMRIAEARGARVVLSGDSRQNDPVSAGNPLAQLEDADVIAVAELKEIRRQEPNPEYLHVAQLVAGGQVLAGFGALNEMGAIVDVEGWKRADYLDRVAEDYVEAISSTNRHGELRSVLVVSPTNQERTEVSEAIRAKLKAEGRIEGEREYETVKALQWTAAQAGDAAAFRHQLREGSELEVRFHQHATSAMPARGPGEPFFNRGAAFSVLQVRDDEVLVRDEQGAVAALPLGSSAKYSVLERRTTAVGAGERLKITQNSMLPLQNPSRKKQVSVSNGDVAAVVKILDSGDMLASIENEGKRTKEVVIPRSFRDFEHGYVVTSVASQGATVDEVMIAQTGPSLGRAASASQFYVSVTRGRENVRLYTSDQERLIRRLQDTGRSMSATELFGRQDSSSVLEERRRRDLARHRAALVKVALGKPANSVRKEIGAAAAARVGKGRRRDKQRERA